MRSTRIRTSRLACAATALLAACVGMAGCGDDTNTPGATPGKADLTWKPKTVDPGTDLFAWDDADARTGASPRAEKAIRTVLADLDASSPLAKVTVDYPLEGTLFPPDLCAPTVLWHDQDNTVNAWLIDVAFTRHDKHVYVVTSGVREQRDIDPRCVTETNVWEEPVYQASARGWTPDEQTWDVIKARSLGSEATLTICGLVGTHGATGTRTVVSRGSVTLSTSTDPVGAPVFYRDVPLMPSTGKDGVIKPLAESALPLIQWRLRDLSKREAPVVMQHLPTCANCHSFSRDGRTLAMDMDGPDGDKGAHVVKAVSRRMVIETGDVFTWNRYGREGKRGGSFGLFPRVSPDGRHVIATVLEEMFVQNYMDWRFLQTFYPTRGILAVHERATGEIRALPGADDPQYVQSNAEWSPDGKWLVFIRAEARGAYGEGPRATHANDPNETQVRYDLYRIPFNEGKGGTPEPVPGASNNGMSNSFPRVTPDGKWIVFVKARNGLLMRPDSRLWIVPSGGGEAREMRCNTTRMNSYHSFSPNGRWMVFSSKWPTPYTQMVLTHLDADGNDTPPVLVPNSTAANRAVNLPEFAPIAQGAIVDITTPAVNYRRHLDRGKALLLDGRTDEATAELETSLKMREDYHATHSELAAAFSAAGRYDEAIAHYRRSLELKPDFYPDHYNWANVLRALGRYDEAIAHYQQAADADPKFFQAENNLGVVFWHKNDLERAATHFRKAVEINPRHALAQNNLAAVLQRLGHDAEAATHYRKALEVDPGYLNAANGLAWVLATSHDDTVRDGAEAVRLAETACQSTRMRNGLFLRSLAAAYAEVGRFDDAVRTAERARVMPPIHNQQALIDEIDRHIALYKAKKGASAINR